MRLRQCTSEDKCNVNLFFNDTGHGCEFEAWPAELEVRSLNTLGLSRLHHTMVLVEPVSQGRPVLHVESSGFRSGRVGRV